MRGSDYGTLWMWLQDQDREDLVLPLGLYREEGYRSHVITNPHRFFRLKNGDLVYVLCSRTCASEMSSKGMLFLGPPSASADGAGTGEDAGLLGTSSTEAPDSSTTATHGTTLYGARLTVAQKDGKKRHLSKHQLHSKSRAAPTMDAE